MTRRRACRHRHDYADSIGIRLYRDSSHVFFTTEIRRCVHCDAWLSLGRSRETPETAIERRAAEIAASGQMPVYVPGCTGSALREGVGWEAHACGFADNWCIGNEDCLAGWLARCIAEHDPERQA